MKLTGTFLMMEEKRTMKILPQYFLGVFLLAALIGGIVAFSTLFTDKKATASDVSVAIVLNDNDFLASFGLDVLESSASAGTLCTFAIVDAEEAAAGLAEGRYDGVINFPDHFVGSVMTGEEVLKAQLYLPKMSGLNNQLIAGIADVGGRLLAETEAGIYMAATAALSMEGVTEADLDRVEYDVQNLFFDFAMSREEFYAKDSASGTGNQTVIQYYACAAFVLLLLLGGISCGPLLKGDPVAFEKQLALHRIGPVKLLAIRYIAVLSLFAVLYTVVFAALFGWFLVSPGSFAALLDLSSAEELRYWFLCGLPVLLPAASIVVFVYTFAANQIGGILLLFIVVMVMGYASGLLSPAAYLPSKVRVVGAYLPTARMLNVMKNAMTHAASTELLLIVAAEALAVLGVAMAIFYGKRRWAE